MAYNVYKVAYVYPTAPTHHALFVETDDTGIGSIFHVRGSIREGMEYEKRAGLTPRLQQHFSKMVPVGTVPHTRLWYLMDVCEGVPPPGRQSDDNDERINPGEPLYCCGEWLDSVIQELKCHGVLDNLP